MHYMNQINKTHISYISACAHVQICDRYYLLVEHKTAHASKNKMKQAMKLNLLNDKFKSAPYQDFTKNTWEKNILQ